MTKNYKLSEQIRGFIIDQKRANEKLSCRGMADLIKKQFQIDISKSLINMVIKQGNLSSPVGRRRVNEVVITVKQVVSLPPVIEPQIPKKEAPIPQKEALITPKEAHPIPVKAPVQIPEVMSVWQGSDFMENSGFFFLKSADLKLGLISGLAEILSQYFPGLTNESHQAIIEAFVYSPYFKQKKNLWLLIGAEVPQETLNLYSEQLILVPFSELKEAAEKVGIIYNSTEINGLWKEVLLRLNSYIVHFFPPEYQFLDFPAMQNRFYFLPGKLGIKGGMLTIQLICPNGFFGLNDIIWQEGFSQAAERVNEAKILTSKKEQIWINPQIQIP
jgi:hypothetical protein